MKVFSVCGISKSGKTTTIEQVIRGLCDRGFRVGSVKEIHFEQFAIDPDPASNTHRHRAAGAELVCARGPYETDLLFPKKLDMAHILCFYAGYDYVVLEGVTDVGFPTIVTAHGEEDLAQKWSDRVFCVSGRIASRMQDYRGVPAIDALTDCERLLDWIQANACDWAPESVSNQAADRPSEQASEQTNRLFSRRNTVRLRQMPVVEKICASVESAELEADFLWLLGDLDVRVPRIVQVEANILRMTHIAGETLPDFLARMESAPNPTEMQAVAAALVDWLAAFYKAVSHETTREIRGDINGRNFLWDGRVLWGVDFEEHVWGQRETDVGRLLAFVETYATAQPQVNARFAQHFRRLAVAKLALDSAAIDAAREQELRDMAQRRAKACALT